MIKYCSYLSEISMATKEGEGGEGKCRHRIRQVPHWGVKMGKVVKTGRIGRKWKTNNIRRIGRIGKIVMGESCEW